MRKPLTQTAWFFVQLRTRSNNDGFRWCMQQIGLRFLHLSYLELTKELASRFRVNLWEIIW